MKVVFDSNVFVSAFLLPGGQADKALLRIVEGRDRLLVSRQIIDEVLGVLARKFSRDREELARAAVWMAELAEMVQPRRRLRVLEDDADNRILECALAGRAAAIVTGDREMLRLGNLEGVKILSLRAYLES